MNFLMDTRRSLCHSFNFVNMTFVVMVIFLLTEAAPRGVLKKKVFLEISQNLQENTCARVSFLIKLQVSGLQLY